MVRQQRPNVVIRYGERLEVGKVARPKRNSNLASIAWKVDGLVVTGAWSYQDVATALNQGKALLW